MALQAIIDQAAFDSLVDNLKTEYKKHGDTGKFILDVASVDNFALEDVQGLKSTLGKVRKELEDEQGKTKAFDGLDAAKAREALQKVEEMKGWTPDDKVKGQIEALKKQLEEKHADELSKATTENSTLFKQLEKVMLESAAIQAIVEEKGNPKLLLPHVLSQAKLKSVDGNYTVEVMDENGNPAISPATGSTAPMSVKELVSQMKTKDDYAAAFEGSGASGAGANTGGKGGYGGKNPFAKETLNLTEQSRLYRENPELAKSLKTQAGA